MLALAGEREEIMKCKITALCVLGFAALNASAQVARSVPDVPANSIRWERTGAAPKAQPSTAPLLTDRRTAASLNLPHTVLQGDIVVVPAEAAARVKLPTVTVVPSEVSTAQASTASTAVMGAGPAPGARSNTVITEMRDPPVTIVQRGQSTTVTPR